MGATPSSPSRSRPALTARAALAAAAALIAAPITTRADIDPLSGIDLVRITHPGNAPWMGDGRPTDLAVGRGRVNYEYSIGRFEVTTSQWVEFFNAAFDRPADDRIPFLSPPTFWGATGAAPTTPGGQRWQVPAGNEMRPVGGISWRMAAIYCNWLHNGKGTSREAFMDGAYDVSTFGFTTGTRFTDQHAHTPGARYWIPTWDELLKASHFDPNRFGDNQPGWWVWNDASTTFATPGPPGVGEANYGFRFQNGVSTYEIPLGAYATRSLWGLIDTAGATREWTEEVRDGGELYRLVEGSYWGSSTGLGVADSIYAAGSELPHINSLEFGLRIASSVPVPACAGVLLGGMLMVRRARRCATGHAGAHKVDRADGGSAAGVGRGRHPPASDAADGAPSAGPPAAPIARAALAAAAALVTFTTTTRADIDPLSGIDLVRITHPGNAPWAGDGVGGDMAIGRGRVDYEYSIGRFEVTTSQWVEFFNAAYDRPAGDRIPHLTPPTFWGAASTTPTTPGGLRWTVPAGNEMQPVGNISWRMAAIYCNWLHNGKSTDRAAFLDGAYDVSTFFYLPLPPGGAADQRTHHPGARYWIPTWDEVLKAFHYDPHKHGPNQGGWWTVSNGSHTPHVYGPPGTLVNGLPTQANAGWDDGGNSQYRVLLGAYPDTQTPWGLLDAGGGTSEWNEEAIVGPGNILLGRGFDGSAWGESPAGARASDFVSSQGSDFPSLSTLDLGFRIASSVPTPSTTVIMVGGWFITVGQRRRKE